MLLAPFAHAQDDETYAEKLGWKKGDRVLIIHVDDAGMSHSSDVGVNDALEKGIATSFSVMMPCPWVPEIVKWIKAHPGVDAGLHLTLTSEWDNYRWGPVAGKPAVPGLCDKEGCLWGNVADVVKHATPDEVETEIRAQLDRALTMGFHPTHLDSHMGTLFATPEFLARYIKVGIDNNIPVMLPAGHDTILKQEYREEAYARVARENKKLPADKQLDPKKVAQEEIAKRFNGIQALGQQVWNAGLPVLDDLHNSSYDWKPENKVKNYIQAFHDLKPGVTMMIMHCTDPSCIFSDISTSGPTRKGDLMAMMNPRVKAALKKEGIILTTWRELKERRDAVK